jgi:hypothetical protein
MNKRRSMMGFQQQQQQIRMKPALEIYRPPSNSATELISMPHKSINCFSDIRMEIPQNKLNVHAQEFTMGNQSNNRLVQTQFSFDN